MFIPDIINQDEEKIEMQNDEGEGKTTKPRRSLGPTSKGALFYAYNAQVHEFIGHLRRIHPSEPVRNIPVTYMGKTTNLDVKAADPLASSGTPLYYFHSKIPMYNDFVFMWWDQCLAYTLRNTCPIFTVKSAKSVQTLLNLELSRRVSTSNNKN